MSVESSVDEKSARGPIAMLSCEARMNYSSPGRSARLKYPSEAKVETLSKCKYEEIEVDGDHLFPKSLTLRSRSQRCRSRSSIPRRRLSAPQRRDLSRHLSNADHDAFVDANVRKSIVWHPHARGSERRRFLDEAGDEMFADAPWRQQRSASYEPVVHADSRIREIVASAFKAAPRSALPVVVHLPLVCVFTPEQLDVDRRAAYPCLRNDSYFQ